MTPERCDHPLRFDLRAETPRKLYGAAVLHSERVLQGTAEERTLDTTRSVMRTAFGKVIAEYMMTAAMTDAYDIVRMTEEDFWLDFTD